MTVLKCRLIIATFPLRWALKHQRSSSPVHSRYLDALAPLLQR